MDVVAVLTTPRRPDYLDAALSALEQAGAGTRARSVFSDGATEAHRAGWRLTSLTARSEGPRLAMRRAWAELLAIGASRVLWLQDDAFPVPGGVDLAFETGVADHHALTSMWDGWELPGARRAGPGVYEVPIMGQRGQGMRGGVALLVPRRTMEWVLSRPCTWPEEARRRGRGWDPEADDFALSWALRDGPWRVRGIRAPSVFEHLGDRSAMGGAERGIRRALWLAGGQ